MRFFQFHGDFRRSSLISEFPDKKDDVMIKNELFISLSLINTRLTPVTLPTWKAEIRRILVQSQPGEIVQETLCQKYPT
jgi:hypothetical protein